ncbi:Hypothetical protein PBPRB1568 [Photobacterium profundum SS9]|uniref:Uncharacterized protein n=1 Tax=Photobacterium profundum (strain SS9) TaxID=298386 RepID=Q6LH00_PHOPR|nr:Hypothetical protein PBPRB1568 [Photobacterium profundum SS9]
MQRDRKMTIENISVNKSFGGWHKQYSHYSNILNCTMQFAIFFPPQVVCGKKVPVIYWLSDVSCTIGIYTKWLRINQSAKRRELI